MHPTLPLGPASDPRLGLAALGALVALASALLFAWRHDALTADPARHPWFAFAVRVQLLVTAVGFVGPAAVAFTRPARGVTALFPALQPLEPIFALAAYVLPSIAIALIATIVAGNVERRLRGAGASIRERVSQTATAIALALLPIVGLVAASARLTAGDERGALACAFGGVLAALCLATLRAGVLGLKPEAATAGPLRDRLFELAGRAGIKLRQVYVLSATRAKLANAFAVRGGNILLTDHLLTQLSRREVEAVIAHELAHLKLKHPAKLGTAFAVPLVVVMLIVILGFPYLPGNGVLAFAVAGCCGWMSVRWWARRFEYQADREAVKLTGDAAALITALKRIGHLNGTPDDWGRAQEWILTHPSTRRRAVAIGATAQLPEAAVESLLEAPPDDPERWELPGGRHEIVFGTAAKRARSAATSWMLLLACSGAPAALFALLHALGGGTPRLAALGLGGLAAFAAALVTVDLLATAGYAAWERSIADGRGREPNQGRFVGLAPGESGMTYEGFADWDLGYLDLDAVALRYEGERSRFALDRERIVAIERAPGLPGWIAAPRAAIRWRAADGSDQVFTLRTASARRLHEIRGQTDRLIAELRGWRAESPPTGVTPLSHGEPPRADAVTGAPYMDLASPRALMPLMPIIAGVGLLVSVVAGLPLSPLEGPGTLDVIGVSMVTAVLLRVPMWRAARSARRGPGRKRNADHRAA